MSENVIYPMLSVFFAAIKYTDVICKVHYNTVLFHCIVLVHLKSDMDGPSEQKFNVQS